MAIEIPDLSIYSIFKLANGMEIKTPQNMWSYGPDQLRVYIFPEGKTLENFELIFQNPQNTCRVQLMDSKKETIYATLNGYTVLSNLEKKYKEAYRKEYDENGKYNIFTTDLFIVELRVPKADDLMPKYESDLEYIAIMSGIDLDTDEE